MRHGATCVMVRFHTRRCRHVREDVRPNMTTDKTDEEERNELRAMTKEELDDLRTATASAQRQKEEELRDWVAPIYFTQRQINAEREYMRREIEELAAYERTIAGEILARTVASWPLLK